MCVKTYKTKTMHYISDNDRLYLFILSYESVTNGEEI